jgi:hypothetical protein
VTGNTLFSPLSDQTTERSIWSKRQLFQPSHLLYNYCNPYPSCLHLLLGSVYSSIVFTYYFLATVVPACMSCQLVLTILLLHSSYLLFCARVNETGNLIFLSSCAKFIWCPTQWHITCTVLVTICLQFNTSETYFLHSSDHWVEKQVKNINNLINNKFNSWLQKHSYDRSVRSVHRVSTYRINNSIFLGDISLFQDVWMQQTLMTFFYYNNCNIILIWHYTLMF